MQKITSYFNEKREREKMYLSKGKRAIAKHNITVLCMMSAWAFCLTLVFMVVAFALFPGWRPSVSHIAFLPVSAIYFLVGMLFNAKVKSPRMISALCFSFNVVVAISVILVDIYSHPETFACFMPVAIIALSGGFFYSTKVSNIFNISFAAVYIFCDMMHKVDYEYIWPFDVFMAIVGVFIAAGVGTHFRSIQIVNFESKMKYKNLSMRDPLLENIFNKRGYEDAIDNYLVSNNPNVRCAFIVLDLNNFKHINDNYGHDMGDNILRCMSSTLLSLFRDSDIIGRFGGDEFIVLADGMCDDETVEKKCLYIAELIGRKAQEAGAIKVFSSLGAVLCDGQNVEFERLFQIADEAMYEAKEMGRDADRFVLRHYSDETPSK